MYKVVVTVRRAHITREYGRVYCQPHCGVQVHHSSFSHDDTH